MSIKVMNAVWSFANCKGSELLILLALADFSDDNGENIYPSMPTLAKKARLSESQARRVVQNLVNLDLLEIVEEGGFKGGRNRSNEYRIRLETLMAIRGSNLTPPPLRPRAQGGRAHDTTVVAHMTPDPSYNTLPEPPKKQKRPPRAQRNASSTGSTPKQRSGGDYLPDDLRGILRGYGDNVDTGD